MRFAFDGLPRDLPLTPKERRRLAADVRTWRPPEGVLRSLWIAFIPAGVQFGGMALWMPVVSKLPLPWRIPTMAVLIAAQTALMFWLLPRAMWKYRWRALHACGYPVCYRCAYPLKDAGEQRCPECGHIPSP